MLNRLISLVLRREPAILPEKRTRVALLVLAVFELALLVATRSLWMGSNEFPTVPLLTFPGATFLVTGLAPKALCLVFVLSICLLIRRLIVKQASHKETGLLCGAVMVCGFCLVVADQHRLQAWHWMFLLNLAAAVLLQGADRLLVMRQIVASVYVCSALSRITPVPVDGITGVIVRQALYMLGVEPSGMSDQAFDSLCHALTAGEFLVGVLLGTRRNGRAGCVGALALHATLLIVLGPWGLKHHFGVLLWNICFLVLVPVLFLSRDADVPNSGQGQSLLRRLVATMVWAFPISGLIGFADNWPSWQLYSSRPESWVLHVHEADRDKLLPLLVSYTGDPMPLSDWCPVKLDRWSLDCTSSPLYPEDRYQLAVIEWVLDHSDPQLRFHVAISEPQRVFWWRRTERNLETRDALQRQRAQFVLGSEAVSTEMPRTSVEKH